MKCPHCQFEWTPSRLRLPRSWADLGVMLFAATMCTVWFGMGVLFVLLLFVH
jgi:hypothetical protein